jgi:DNA-binding response OmpR family regulator
METILVIEDNAALRRYMGNCLRKAGYEVVQAESGKSAFSHLRDTLVDLVLLDLKLGDVDGLEILKTIRHQTDSLPVIIV